jgi:hypothetical protein
MFSEIAISALVGDVVTACEPGISVVNSAWREHPGQRAGWLYLLRLREYRRQRARKPFQTGFSRRNTIVTIPS